MKKGCFFLLLLFIVFSLPVYGDTIYLNTMERRSNLQVSDDGASQVRYREKDSGKYIQMGSEKVSYVIFDKAPNDLTKGMDYFRKQNYKKAIDYLGKVKKQQYIIYAKFYIAMSYQHSGDFRKALQEYKYFNKSMNNRLTPRAFFQQGMVYIFQKNYSSARRIFENLKEANFNQFWKYKAKYGVGLANLYRKNYSKAQEEFVSVENACKKEKDPSFALLKQLAIQGWGLSLVGDKVYSKAQEKFNQVLKESTNEEVLAGAYLGLGRMYYSIAGDGKDSSNNYKRALLSFLKVSTLYPGLKLQYAEALYLASRCYEKLSKNKEAKYLTEEIKRRVPEWARYKGL